MGGAVYFESGYLQLVGRMLFENNHAVAKDGIGGALTAGFNTTVVFSGIAVNFINNSADFGGGVAIFNSMLLMTADEIGFENNSARSTGGGLGVAGSSVLKVNRTKRINFIRNCAPEGGGIYCEASNCSFMSANFINNTGTKFGCGALSVSAANMYLHDINVTGNSGSAMCIFNSNAIFRGTTKINNNIGNGGGIRAWLSTIHFTGVTIFEENYSITNTNGGAMQLLLQTTLSISNMMLFRSNNATGNGGGIFASDSRIISNYKVNFTSNQARNGGAMYFENGATLLLKHNTTIATSYNHATEYGGAIYHRDAITPSQCEYAMSEGARGNLNSLPNCFLHLELLHRNISSTTTKISSSYDMAGTDGSFLYGGLLDKCYIILIEANKSNIYPALHLLFPILMEHNHVNIKSNDTTVTESITSEPYELCFCKSIQEYNCSESEVMRKTVYRGKKFTVYLLALAQGDTISSTSVRAKLNRTARLKQNQRLQILPHNCTAISFNMYYTESQEEIILYPDSGSCRDIGAAQAVIDVTLLPCPDPLILSDDYCICEERLQEYAECKIVDDEFYIARKPNSKFWMNSTFSNGTYQGLILCPTCPIGYCSNATVNISLVRPDVQCDHNRSGVLCGACAANYSLMLGSSRCETCTNTYLALIFPFAAAGIALVAFLSVLRLTVATGMINSVILYANIVQANRNLLFPTASSTSVLTVFIAWMNLDLGFHTCFYHGMDTYAKTWLQFAFPVYVWFLISLIILTSRYSMTVTKLLGSNPIDVLATLLLMSYTKVLKIIIEVYSSVNLDYPGNKTVTVWLKDANVPYLQSWHLALTVVTTLMLVFLFLPYTLLLLLGYKLYRFTGRRHTRWIIRIKPLLDSYYAPYEKNTRYWTGFLLLARCALYIMFSYDSLGHTTKSLFAINAAFTAILSMALLSYTIYTSFFVNMIEGLVYANLLVLSAAISNDISSPTLVNILIGMVFTIMIGIILYHFHIHYTTKSRIWMKVLEKQATFKREVGATEATPLLAPANFPPFTRFDVVREPLLTK